jgi:hypothetical protein
MEQKAFGSRANFFEREMQQYFMNLLENLE